MQSGLKTSRRQTKTPSGQARTGDCRPILLAEEDKKALHSLGRNGRAASILQFLGRSAEAGVKSICWGQPDYQLPSPIVAAASDGGAKERGLRRQHRRWLLQPRLTNRRCHWATPSTHICWIRQEQREREMERECVVQTCCPQSYSSRVVQWWAAHTVDKANAVTQT